jgi:CPA2 family monovalent cation:H+ antiporter-2
MPVMMAAGTEIPAYLGPTAVLVIAAAAVGYLCVRMRVVPIVGFLLAGVLIGPAQLGLVSSTASVDAAAEVGVILLLFTIGIEFSLDRLAAVWRWIVAGGGAQVTLTTLAVLGLAVATGSGWRAGLFTGFLIALSSTAIVIKVLADAHATGTVRGRLALAVLILQDLAVVAMVMVIPLLGESATGGLGSVAEALGLALLVVVVVLLVARRVMPRLLEWVAAACSPEVFLLAVMAICFGTAYLTALTGISVSLGAFLAGLVVSESRHSTHALSEVLPLQVIFSAVFFVSVGMLLDLGVLLDNLPTVIAAGVLVVALKVATTTLALLPLRVGWRQAAATGLLLGQVGEFSFVLLRTGQDAGISLAGFGADGEQVFLATSVMLLVLTPGLAWAADRIAPRDAMGASRQPGSESAASGSGGAPDSRNHVLILGWGEDSLAVADELVAAGHEVVMTTLNPGGAQAAERAGVEVVRGDSTRSHILLEAGVADARLVIVAEDDPEQTSRIAETVRGVSSAPVLVRPRGEPDLERLADVGVEHVVHPGRVARKELTSTVMRTLAGPAPERSARSNETSVDVTRLVAYHMPGDSDCTHGEDSHAVLPGSTGCAECLRTGSSWVHLRLCLTCGHVGCCDSSPGRHARAHHGDLGHPLVASVEPGDAWAYCFLDDTKVSASIGDITTPTAS